MTNKKKKKRHCRHYKTGLHTSQKLQNGPAKFRSGWEDAYMNWLDNNVDVVQYSYESVIVGYLGNKKTGKLRHYYPDLLVEFVNGDKKLIEIKPSTKVQQKTNQKKFEAAKTWCSEHDVMFEIVTEIDMKKLGIEL